MFKSLGMKKGILLIVTIILMGCGASKSLNGVAGIKTLKGEWQVNKIEFIGAQGTYKAFMFDLADSYCFKNGVWMFIPNNNTGKFSTLANASTCEATSNRIRWTFYDTDTERYLQFKYVDSKNKTIDPGNRGYRVKIVDLNESTMTTEVNVTYDNNPFTVVMYFSKISTNVVL